MTIDSISKIYLENYPHTIQTVTLGGIDYRIEFKYNNQFEDISMSIYTSDETPVIHGMKVVFGLNILNGVSVPNMPKGSLIAYSPDIKARISSLDNGVCVFYSEEVYDDIYEMFQAVGVI